MELFFIIWNENGKNPKFKHQDEASARDEAERLAFLNPRETFHVLRLVDSCKKNDVTWASGVNNDVPF